MTIPETAVKLSMSAGGARTLLTAVLSVLNAHGPTLNERFALEQIRDAIREQLEPGLWADGREANR